MRVNRERAGAAAVTAMVVVAVVTGCGPKDVDRRTSAALRETGDLDAGREAMEEAGCGSCHRIPGIRNAESMVGPPLDAWSQRSFVAGILPNTPDNMALWLADPDEIRPGTAMPDLELDDREIVDITAYLFSLD